MCTCMCVRVRVRVNPHQVWLELDALLSSLADRTDDAPLGSKLGYALYSN